MRQRKLQGEDATKHYSKVADSEWEIFLFTSQIYSLLNFTQSSF